MHDGGKLIRIVDVVVLLLRKEGSTDLLVETEEAFDGDKEYRTWLTGIKGG